MLAPGTAVDKILEMTERYPTYSYVRISQQLRLVGVGVSPSAVRYVWQRHGLTLRYQRLVRNPLSVKKLVYLDGQQAHERSHPRSRPASHAVLRRVREPRPG